MPVLAQIRLQFIARDLVPGGFLRRALQQNLENWERKHTGPFPHLLKQRIVRSYAAASGARIFVETGTYYGFMVQACLTYFDQIISIEVEPHFYRRAQKVFRNQRNVTLLCGDSAELLPTLVTGIKQPCLFWLDAHYSGGLTSKANLETPIRRELEAVLNHSHRHMILIDDANCFNGTHDYPRIAWIEDAARDAGYCMSVSDNIIRLVGEPLNRDMHSGTMSKQHANT